MACISTYHTVPQNLYIGVTPSYHSFAYHPMEQRMQQQQQQGRRSSISRTHPTVFVSHTPTYTIQGSSPTPSTSPYSPNPSQSCDSRWSAQLTPQRNIPAKQHSYPEPTTPRSPQPQQPKSHSRTYSGEGRRRNSQQAITQSYFPPISFHNERPTHVRSGSTSSSSPSPPTSPLAFNDVLAPVHPLYEGLPRTESGLIPIPNTHTFTRGEIVMTRTTRRLMKTSATGRLTARHPCLILETTPTHVRVLQMTSHVSLSADQVRIVGARLEHWLAREDDVHFDVFGRQGLRTSPRSERAGYIWVGDGGEWVPIEQVKYLTGTRVEEGEMQRLESLICLHVNTCPFKPFSDSCL